MFTRINKSSPYIWKQHQRSKIAPNTSNESSLIYKYENSTYFITDQRKYKETISRWTPPGIDPSIRRIPHPRALLRRVGLLGQAVLACGLWGDSANYGAKKNSLYQTGPLGERTYDRRQADFIPRFDTSILSYVR